MSKVVLAFSGGLDTTVCVPLLKEEYGYNEVVAVTVDVGQPKTGLKEAEKTAKKLGVEYHQVNAKKEFVEDYIKPLIKANGDYEGYLLGHAIARPLIAEKIYEVAKKEKADALAHGCTGKGNDQFRFEATFKHLTQEMDIIAPIRDMNLTREEEIDYARKNDIPITTEGKEEWSIDENLWSRSIEGGKLENPSFEPPEEVFEWTNSPKKTPDEPSKIKIRFEEGEPVCLNNKELDLIEIIKKLNQKAGKHGVGRVDMIEDRILGLKARENYEHPAATVLQEAHKDLENLTLTRNQLNFKSNIENEWSDLVYKGLVVDPLFEDLNSFINSSQKNVNGEVKLKLHKGSIKVISRKSENAIYNQNLVSFDEKKLDQKHAKGAIKFHGIQSRNLKNKKGD
ncbi:argininosuccinate synthase [archaeon SCG-AAA382B04]|nr:argininosuccinate synthase [archaeon SCG-AAA382B04]